jgi:hypothetical protein
MDDDNGGACCRQHEELEEIQFKEMDRINLEQESFCLEWQMFLDNL